ncbi:hypothetical protein FHU14_003562 [Mesorhizobium sp. RMAD-H1]|nr:hypothetical protein [Mesorhizobium sp. RMAD-H1]
MYEPQADAETWRAEECSQRSEQHRADGTA